MPANPANRPDRLPELIGGLPRPVALAGFGVEGRETLAFLLSHGVREVEVYDRSWPQGGAPEDAGSFPGVRFHGDGDWAASLARAGTAVRSPGVRPDHPGLLAALAAGTRVTSATELFLAACPGPVVGVTGTLGKGTTVSLIEAALSRAGVPCRSGGNIGLNPLAFLAGLTPETVTVLELSSFQLMGLAGRKPDVAVVLRTTSEHLDWHPDVGEYRAAKRGLLAPTEAGQHLIFCADSEGSREVIQGREQSALACSRVVPVRDGIGVAGGLVMRFAEGRASPLAGLEQLALPGKFNLENAAPAYLAAELLGADPQSALAAIAEFPGLPHRLERCGAVEGVACYNDSYATRPEATLGAISAFAGPLALIAGGSEKNADFAPLAEGLCRHRGLRRVVLIGATGPRIGTEVKNAADRLGITPPPLLMAGTLEEAVTEGLAGLAGEGVLLFSPACASFDMFPNYKVRGERFKALVGEPET